MSIRLFLFVIYMNRIILQMVGEEPAGEEARLVHNSLTLPVMAYARSSGLFSLLRDRLHLSMKTVRYTPTDKVVEFMASLVAGCQHTVSINHRLVPDTELARECIGKPRFADQSGVNRLLRSFTEQNLEELEDVLHQYYLRHSLARRHPGREILVIDMDITGLKADGKTYEGTSKGYFPGEKGAKGYQCGFACVHRYREVLGFVLGPGSARVAHHLDDLLDLVDKRLKGRPRALILLRGDGAHGTSTCVKKTLERGYLMLFKGKLPRSARMHARHVRDWKPLKDGVWGGESALKRITGRPYTLRVAVFRKAGEVGVRCWHLITNLPGDEYPVERLLDLYFAREGAEAYVKTDKSGLHLRNLRTRCLNGIKAALALTLLTHNLILHALKAVFKPPLRVRVKAFVEKYASLPAWLIRRGVGILKLVFKKPNPLIGRYLKSVARPNLLDYI